MKQVAGTIKDLFTSRVDGNGEKMDLLHMTATKEQYDEFFNDYDCVCLRYPENMLLYGFAS